MGSQPGTTKEHTVLMWLPDQGLWTFGAKKRPNLRTYLDNKCSCFPSPRSRAERNKKNIRKMNKKSGNNTYAVVRLCLAGSHLPPLDQDRQFHPNKRHSVTLQISHLL